MLLNFGAGDLFATMIQDAFGAATTNPTPIRIAGMQEVSVDFSGDLKEYYGQNRYALAVAMGKVKTSGKFKGATFNGLALNTLFFGSGPTTGTMRAIVADTAGTVVPTTPFQITPTVPNSGTWVEDLGVTDSNGFTLVKVASGPTTGQYSVTAGVYTFAAADVAKRMYISFAYTYTLAAAKRISLQNLAMGYTPLIKLNYQTVFQGKRCLLALESCIIPKLGLLSAKNDDFSVPEMDFSAQCDSSGLNLGDIYMTE